MAARRPVLVDIVLAGVTVVVMLASVWTSSYLGAPKPVWSTYALAAVIGLPILVRRLYPLQVLWACALLLFVFYLFHGDAGIAPMPALGVALYSAAAAGHQKWSIGVAVGYMVAGTWALIFAQHEDVVRVVQEILVQTIVLVSFCLLGDAVHTRRRLAEEVRSRLAAAEQERDREAARRVDEERLRIARELHDVLAHTISALTIQARVIKDRLEDPPPQVREATEAIIATSREAMAEVRATVGLLREAEAGRGSPTPPAPGVAQLETVLATARASGLDADCTVLGSPVPVPAAVDLTAYRIVQEALGAANDQGGAGRATVWVGFDEDTVSICVSDDGVREGDRPLLGMRERVHLYGGDLSAGPRRSGGHEVRARLPLEGVPA
jgi:signal transduction histidine kinase